ncbi:hypothetical protein ACWGH2_41755 [Streptomyces sp. NPDC054871]
MKGNAAFGQPEPPDHAVLAVRHVSVLAAVHPCSDVRRDSQRRLVGAFAEPAAHHAGDRAQPVIGATDTAGNRAVNPLLGLVAYEEESGRSDVDRAAIEILSSARRQDGLAARAGMGHHDSVLGHQIRA